MPLNVSVSTRNWLTREGPISDYSQQIDSSAVPGRLKPNPRDDDEGDIQLRAGCSFSALRLASFFSFFSFFSERAVAVACAIRDPTS